jgi:hypothetical protein
MTPTIWRMPLWDKSNAFASLTWVPTACLQTVTHLAKAARESPCVWDEMVPVPGDRHVVMSLSGAVLMSAEGPTGGGQSVAYTGGSHTYSARERHLPNAECAVVYCSILVCTHLRANTFSQKFNT